MDTLGSQHTNFQMPVIFLGVCERAAIVQDAHPAFQKLNLVGLKPNVLSLIFPLPLHGINMVFAVRPRRFGEMARMKIFDEKLNEVGSFDVGLSVRTAVGSQTDSEAQPLASEQMTDHWIVITAAFSDNSIMIMQPGVYSLVCEHVGRTETVGYITFIAVDVLPLTEDRIDAIRADPMAGTTVSMHLNCRVCMNEFVTYAALDRTSKEIKSNWLWYATLPDRFNCSCGRTSIDLQYLRRNLHGMLGTRRGSNGGIQFMSLYEKSTLEMLAHEFSRLLSTASREEELQQFIERNPILLHQFAANRLFFKPAILTRYKADFAILTPQNELLLVEIEKNSTRLLNKDGSETAEFTHARHQVSSWLDLVDEHRSAFVDSLGLKERVSGVRGVMIAGRDGDYNLMELRRVKNHHRGRIEFYTYDDLLAALRALAATFK